MSSLAEEEITEESLDRTLIRPAAYPLEAHFSVYQSAPECFQESLTNTAVVSCLLHLLSSYLSHNRQKHIFIFT